MFSFWCIVRMPVLSLEPQTTIKVSTQRVAA